MDQPEQEPNAAKACCSLTVRQACANITLEELGGCSCGEPECPRAQPETHHLPAFTYMLVCGYTRPNGELATFVTYDGDQGDLLTVGGVLLEKLHRAGMLHQLLAASGVGGGVAAVHVVGGVEAIMQAVAEHLGHQPSTRPAQPD